MRAGGRAVVTDEMRGSAPGERRSASVRIWPWHMRPWHGPIVIVV